MRHTTPANNRWQLPVLDHHSRASRPYKLPPILQNLWRSWIVNLKASRDPRIWQTIDPLGNTWWHAYNPATGRSATRESETAILEWLESAR